MKLILVSIVLLSLLVHLSYQHTESSSSSAKCILVKGKSSVCPSLPTRVCVYPQNELNGGVNVKTTDMINATTFFTKDNYLDARKAWNATKQCPRNHRLKFKTQKEYCGFYQPCDSDEDCLPICYAYCYQCNEHKVCQSKVNAGVYASKYIDSCFNPGSTRPPPVPVEDSKEVEEKPSKGTSNSTTVSSSEASSTSLEEGEVEETEVIEVSDDSVTEDSGSRVEVSEESEDITPTKKPNGTIKPEQIPMGDSEAAPESDFYHSSNSTAESSNSTTITKTSKEIVYLILQSGLIFFIFFFN
ncbi:hypothetical protein DLAC_01299 [Tieghemostelium lacteum]|uniref:Uncharacterized protein n=1 Tax=Tieghemostelium lacteum TaxID=361077 RepID=A0A152A8D0_TIELA|nr:hypothetical protein DLAC_01299 [Tieghemostelium lacteum]|eukprot:KYR02458.1 hypothetical protein DLAC_01299 [Tieghemostelium lacteum]